MTKNEIYLEIRRRICLLDYKPGSRLNERELATEFGISRTPMRLVKTIHMHFGYDIRKLVHTDLANDPLLSFIFCRLHYRLRPEPIPSSLRGRAEYWKQFYNSMAGKGTVKHYLDNANAYLYCLTPSDLSTPPCP